MIGPNSAKHLILKKLDVGVWSSLMQCVRWANGIRFGCYGGC